MYSIFNLLNSKSCVTYKHVNRLSDIRLWYTDSFRMTVGVDMQFITFKILYLEDSCVRITPVTSTCVTQHMHMSNYRLHQQKWHVLLLVSDYSFVVTYSKIMSTARQGWDFDSFVCLIRRPKSSITWNNFFYHFEWIRIFKFLTTQKKKNIRIFLFFRMCQRISNKHHFIFAYLIIFFPIYFMLYCILLLQI